MTFLARASELCEAGPKLRRVLQRSRPELAQGAIRACDGADQDEAAIRDFLSDQGLAIAAQGLIGPTWAKDPLRPPAPRRHLMNHSTRTTANTPSRKQEDARI